MVRNSVFAEGGVRRAGGGYRMLPPGPGVMDMRLCTHRFVQRVGAVVCACAVDAECEAQQRERAGRGQCGRNVRGRLCMGWTS